MFLGLDISRDDVAAILANESGASIVALRSALPTEGGSPAIWMCVIETAREAMKRAQVAPENLRAAALSMEVPFDARGVIGRGTRTDGWEDFDAPRALCEHLGIARAVAANRAFCAARGEARYGALRTASSHENPSGETSSRENQARTAATNAASTRDNASRDNAPRENEANFTATNAASTRDNAARDNGGEYSRGENWLFVHLDSQLGAAACVDGTMLRGENNRALDLGAACIDRDGALGESGKRGTLAAYCSGDNFVSRAAGYGITVRSAREVWLMAPQNYAARTLCDDFVRRLAQGIGIALAVLDVRRVVFGGALSDELGETLLAPLRGEISEFWRTPQENASTRKLRLEVAQLGRDAAVLGAVDLALQSAFR